ncbi:MAG: M36 family metallopeptidase, partial [Verrucomicrobiia bacterium]
MNEHSALFGHGAEVLANVRVKRDYVTPHNGMNTVVWQQELDGIAVFDGVLMAHTTQRGELVNVSSQFLADPAKAADKGSANRLTAQQAPKVSAAQAVVAAANSIGETTTEKEVTATGQAPIGAEKRQHHTARGLLGETDAKLVWLPMNRDTLQLCWEVVLTSQTRGEMFQIVVDAQTGEVLVRRCLTTYISDASYNVFTSDSPSPFSPGHLTPSSVQPALVSRQMVTLSALSTTASPNGWINDGNNTTLGNNVDAHLDKDANNVADPGSRPTGSPFRVFDFPMDLAQAPATYTNACVVQLFYWNNFMHDKLYELGFTEAAGNFQTDNFGRGGLGNDAVQADAQDGSGSNNANFSTPTDGSAPRMQMFIFTGPTPDRDGDFDAEIVLHEYTHGLSNRLVGGGVGMSALQSRGLGEGWSDFYGMALLSEATDDANANYATGGYATYQFSGLTANYYYGIRRYPYSTDMTKNPLTFKDIDPAQASSHSGIPRSPIIGNTANEVHNMGEVWCVMLWEARAKLINKHGWTTGNQLILQLVTDGMKLSPANPTYIQARDAILQADQVLTGGANRNELWAAFAKRGLGFSATAPASSTATGVVEAYDVPDDLGVSPATSFTSSGDRGGPFTPSTMNYVLTNSGAASVNWTATKTQSWASLSATSGTLAPGAYTTVTCSLNSDANTLPYGSYSDTLTFSNSNSGVTQSRVLKLRVSLSVVVAVFDNPLYVDTGGGSSAESDNVQASLANQGHSVVTFTDISSGIAGQSVVLIPEQEKGALATALSAAERTALQDFVQGGGTLVIHGSHTSTRSAGLINSILGTTVSEATETVGVVYNRTDQAAGTSFADNPATLAAMNGSDYLATASLPASALSIYTNGTRTLVAVLPSGAGRVVFLGWDWYDAAPVGSQDGGWLQVLSSAVTSGIITQPPVIATDSPLPWGTVGVGCSETLAARGGAAPYTWSLQAGSLPSGLSLSSAGVISGTPDTAGTASFTVQVTGHNDLSSTKNFVLTIQHPPVIINGVTVNDSGIYMVGADSGFNGLIITNGGVLTSEGGVIGNSGIASNNYTLITGGGSLWSNSGNLYVGGTGGFNTLILTNGGAVSATNIVVGFDSSSTGNAITVSGGHLRATNADGGGALEVRYGALTFNSGTVTVDRLLLTNGAISVLNFNGGTLNSGGSVVTNGALFKVGNGSSAATLHLAGGTHSFANGLFINANGWLTGTGAITGVITNAGSIAPGDSLGILTGSSDLTLLSSSLLLMELAGTNNWLYDQINLAGTLTFGGTLSLSLLDGFMPSAGDRFDLFDFSSSSGSFSLFNLPTLSPLLYWDTSALYTSGEIEADVLPPGVIAWGYNDSGQTNVPVGLTAVTAISAGEGYNMALKSDGTVVAWGGNGNGATNVPVGLSGVTAISAGSHNMALKSNGTVVAWGYNNYGQTNVPAGLSNVVAIAAGTLHSMVIRSDGTVFAWGDNSDGKTNVPAGLSGVVAIAGSQWHSMALKSNGTVVAWGSNGYGQTNVPVGLSNVVAIAAGPYHNMALKSNGTVVAWGDGLDTMPVGLSNVVAIAAASQHSAALKSDGTVVVWGSNSYGQTNMPPGLCGVVAMGARGLNTMVLRPYGPAVTPSDLMLPSGVRGTIYNHPLQATGGTAPYSWAVTSGRLPSGLTLDSSGILSGTPTALGLSCFRVRVTGADGLATDKDFALKICQAPTITTASTLPPGAVGVVYSLTLTASEGATPYIWSLFAGSLPSGLSLSSAGVISGTPDTVATASFTVQVTDSDGLSSTKDFSLMVYPAPTTTIIDGVTVNDPGTYMVGTNSGLNALIITNGGVLTSSGGVIGNSAIASANRALVTGPGSLWSNGGSLYVGSTGSFNTLTLTNGGAVSSTNIIVGFDSSSTGNVITVSGGHLRATNTDGGGALEVRYGAFTFNSGTVTVDRLLLTNGANSIFNFNGGTLNSGGGAVSNGAMFKVGNGTSAATLHLAGGTHGFADGLFINTNSWLTGTGAITGVITNAGSIAPGDSLGTITANNSLTLLGSSLLMMELAGTSDWLYDQINVAGTLTFGGSLTLSLLDGFTVSLGDRFDLFDFSSSSGSFSQFNLPTLSPLLYWDTSALYTSGEIEADVLPPGVIVWGYNDSGQTNVPVGLTAVAAISAGEGYNVALRNDGTVVAWGGNGNGETNVPAGLSGVSAISAGSHSMALKSDGTVVAWGRNVEGQTNVPPGLSGVVAIAAGTLHSMVIRTDGTVFAWGDNSNGKTNVPAGLSGVVAVAGSQWHSLALKSNGTVIAWGTSAYHLTNVPTGLSNVVAIAAGPYHNMALKSNGTVVAWGDGLDTVPTGLSNVVAIAAASQHSAALKRDGTVAVWGSNSYGQTNMPPGLYGVVAMGARNLDTIVLRPYGPVVTPSDLMLPTGARGNSYNHPLQATGGTAPYNWTVTSGRLPSGLALGANGILSGTPIAFGLSCFRVRVTGADGLATDKDLALMIGQAPTIAANSPLPSGTVGVAYNQALAASNGATPYTWSLFAGSLPSGLSLSSAGVISGTPDTAAITTFTVQVTSSDGFSSTKDFTLTILRTPTIIDGVTVNDPGTYMVGNNSSFNPLIITNGGVLTSAGGVIGNSAVSSYNIARVTGAGSIWSNSGSLYVGSTGSFNTLILTSGGAVSATNIVVGFDSSSTGNVITVSGGYLLATNADGGGALEVRYGAFTFNSGTVTVDRLVLTNGANSTFNFNGGSLTAPMLLNAGRFTMTGGTLSVSGAFTNAVGGTFNLSGGSVLVPLQMNNMGTFIQSGGFFDPEVLTNSGSFALSGGTNMAEVFLNLLSGTVTQSGGEQDVNYATNFGSWTISSGVANLTNFINEDHATLTVSGGTLNGSLTIGNTGSFNTLTITNGGIVAGSVGVIGNASLSSNNIGIVTGSGSLWANNGFLYIGNSGSVNRLTVSSGGQVLSSDSYIGYGSASTNNSVVVTGTGSGWSNNTVLVGVHGSSNSMTIADGGHVVGWRGYIGYYAESSNNAAIVTAEGSLWSNSGSFYVGLNGSAGSMTIANGGQVINGGGFLGYYSSSSNNTVWVTDSGSRWVNTVNLNVGSDGPGNQLTISNNGTVNAPNIVIGSSSTSTGNVITVSGGYLYGTNTSATGWLDVRRGTLTLNSGTVTVNQLIATNFANSVVSFNGGTLNSGGSTLNNGSIFQVGNGTSAATLHLLGGTHSFANGLFINTNSWLTGTGAITGVITNAGSIAPGDSPGILTVSGDLTLLTNSLLAMELAGTNNGLYDQINVSGALAFDGTLTLSLL